MRLCVVAAVLLCAASTVAAEAQDHPFLVAGTEVSLTTDQPLSSKTSVKGDMVALVVASDVTVGSCIIVPKGTAAVGQISDARAKGAMGMTGKLEVRALYLRLGDAIVRLDGLASDKATVSAGAVIGMALVTPGFTGRSSEIPRGTPLHGHVLRDTPDPEGGCAAR